MYHYNYKITNTQTKEFYIGVRSCECEIENDPYMGSSSVWTKIYIKEHKDVLKKEILEVFKTRKLANAGEVIEMSITEFCKLHPELNPGSMRKSAENGWIYHKRYKITECAASSSNTSSKSDKNGEPLEVDNPVGSLGSK